MHLYFTGTGIIFQVDISQRLDWSATSHTQANIVDQRKWYFPWYPIFYYTVSLFNWLWQTRVKFTCFPSHATKTEGCHDQQSEWTMFYLYDSLIILSFLFTLIYFVCFSEFCTSIYRRAIGLNTLEIQNHLAAISTHAYPSMIFAVLSCSDSPVSCWNTFLPLSLGGKKKYFKLF